MLSLMIHLDFETLNSPKLEALLSKLSLLKAWSLCRSFDKPNFWFLCIRILMVRKFQNMLLLSIYLGMQSHLWPQRQDSCFPPRSNSKGFHFWGVLVLISVLSFPWNWLLIVEESQVFVKMDSLRFSKPGLPITTNLMSSFKVPI